MRNKIIVLGFLLAIAPLGAEETSNESTGTFSSTPWNLKFSDHFIYSQAPESALEADSPVQRVFKNEYIMRVDKGSWNNMVQLSTFYSPDPNTKKNAPLRMEKVRIGYEGDSWNVKLGDSYQELGRGIALSLYNDSTFGIDNTLMGTSIFYRGEVVEAGTFAGLVNSLRSPVAINPVTDPLLSKDVIMAGAQAKVHYTKDGAVGAHGLVTLDQNFTNRHIEKKYLTAGLSVSQENIVDGLDAYAESNILLTEQLEPSKTTLPQGNGSYASVTYSALPWKVKVEGKDYRKFEYDWRRPPTLEEEVVRQNNFIDVTGMRVAVERRLFETGTANVGLSYLVADDREMHSVINHPVASTKFPVGDSLEFELRGGYRWLPGHQNVWHTSAKGKLKTWKGEALELEYKKQFWNLGLETTMPGTEERNQFALGYTFNERISALLGFEYIPTNDAEDGKNFVNIGGAYRSGNLNVRTFIGKTSGGTQCSGGVCRKVDPYTGAYLEGSITF